MVSVSLLETMSSALKELVTYGIYPHAKSTGEVAFHVTDRGLFNSLASDYSVEVRPWCDKDFICELFAKTTQFEMFCLVPAPPAQVQGGGAVIAKLAEIEAHEQKERMAG